MITFNWTYHGNQFEMYEYPCCIAGTNIVLLVDYIKQTNKQTKQTQRKGRSGSGYQIQWDETRETGWWQSRVINFPYKINKYGYDVQQNKYFHWCSILNLKVLKGVNAKSFHTF